MIPLWLTVVALATVAGIHKKMFEAGLPLDLALCKITLIISNEEINDIIKIIKSPLEPGLLIKGVSKAIKNEANK